MHPITRLYALLLFDFCTFLLFDLVATSLVAVFIWFWATFCFWDERPPDLTGIPHSMAELQRELFFVSIWCLVFAVVAAGVNFLIVRRVGRELRFESRVARRWAMGSALVHGVIVFLPMVWPCYAHWVQHTTFGL